MSKWCGKVGYVLPSKEVEPGIWESESVVEKTYYGDLTSNKWRRQNTGEINSDVRLTEVISIVADPFAYENYAYIGYVEIMGVKWTVSDIELSQKPRLILTIGGVWNGNTPDTSE